MSPLEQMEKVEEMLVDWLYDTITKVTDMLSPSGKPYGMEPQTEEEQLQEYLPLRADPNKYLDWMNKQLQFFIQKLKENGLDDQQINSIHPYNVILQLTAAYTDKMERMLHASVSTPS